MQATRDSEIPVGDATELSWYRTGTDYDPRLYNANIYHNSQAADSIAAYEDHPLRDASLEMLGRAILGAMAVASLAMVAFLWWLV